MAKANCPKGTADDLVAFAKALTDSGTRFFGAAWCPHCTDQRQLFQDGGKFLPFVEVTNPDRTPNQVAIDEGVTEYPTWEFPDGTRLTGVHPQTLTTKSGMPISSVVNSVDCSHRQCDCRHWFSAQHPDRWIRSECNPLTITVTSSTLA
ncbi:MAG: hypothetical protein R3C56_04300 [Pirellulaceae bacterium]